MKNLISLNNRLKKIYEKIGEATQVNHLCYFRIMLGFLLFPYVGPEKYNFWATLPDTLFRPHVLNFTNLFDSWPSDGFFQLLYYAHVVLSIAIIFGFKARYAFALLGLVILIKSGFSYSLGKIDHGILYTLLPFFMSFTNSGCKLAVLPDKINNRQDLTTTILAVCLVFGFFTAGYEKALNWIDFNTDTNGFLRWFYHGYYSLGMDQLLAPYVLYFPWWLTEIFDYTAVIFEVSGFIFLFFGKRTWLWYLLIACIFHLLNTLFLNIAFKVHIVVFGLWLINPFLERFKIFILLVPAILYFSDLKVTLIGWIFTIILGGILLLENYGIINTNFLSHDSTDFNRGKTIKS